MLYLVNGFSTGMLGYQAGRWGAVTQVEFTTLQPWIAGKILRENEFVSCFGHADTAWHLSRYLKVDVPVSRQSISVKRDDMVLVASARMKREYHAHEIGCPKWSFYLVRFK